jgi:amino acid adenylation domain-containing protein
MQVNILEYFEQGALKNVPDATAIADGERGFTFAQLARHAKAFATCILDRPPGSDGPIAVFLPKCAETVIADLGILYAGHFFCNLDTRSPAQRIRNILDNLHPSLMVTSRSLGPDLQALGASPDQILFLDDAMTPGARIDTGAIQAQLQRTLDLDPVCIINTSGSTGTPKGVVLHHRGTIDFLDWAFQHLGLDGSERIGSLSPFYFDIYTLELGLCLAKGATLVIVPEGLAIFPVQLVEFVAIQRISFIFWVPTIMVAISNQGLLDKFDLSALKKILFAGEVFPTRHFNQWHRHLPWATFVNLYGPIEIHVDCTFFVVDRVFADEDPLPIGFPCRNSDILVLDDHGRPCVGEAPGELCVRGASLALGYWNDPVKTALAFPQNPLHAHFPERIYRTGDLVCLNARGELLFIGRKDYQIKHLGYRIELPEIEHQILTIPGIANACVLYNQERKEITLFYENPGEAVGAAQIRQHLAAVFPKYMLPVTFHKMPELPRNPNGKIDRNGLAALMSQR